MLTLAFRTGVRQLWRERILGHYLRGEIGRNEAIEAVGIDWVELAERQHQAMMEDLAWALGKSKPPSLTQALFAIVRLV
ncbi:MAG: hypothetical protein WBW48_21720 [Anaerolineae bacterium]